MKRIPCAGEQTESGRGYAPRHPSADTGTPDGVSPQAWAEDTMSETTERGEGLLARMSDLLQRALVLVGEDTCEDWKAETHAVIDEHAALRPAVPPAPEGLRFYSGEASRSFWDRVNALPWDDRQTVYLLACGLQDIERRVFQLLEHAESALRQPTPAPERLELQKQRFAAFDSLMATVACARLLLENGEPVADVLSELRKADALGDEFAALAALRQPTPAPEGLDADVAKLALDNEQAGRLAVAGYMRERERADRLEAELAALRPPTPAPSVEAQGWQDVRDSLPKLTKAECKPDAFGRAVLIYPPHQDGGTSATPFAYYGTRQTPQPEFYIYGRVIHPTHWMPLPTPPKEDGRG